MAGTTIPPGFRNWSIRRKLSVIVMATTTLALLLAAIGMLASDSILFRGYLERDLCAELGRTIREMLEHGADGRTKTARG